MNPHYMHDEEIDAEVLDVVIETVNSYGYADIQSEYEKHLVAWVPLEVLGVLRTDAVRENRRDDTSAWIQQSDGNVKIGPSGKWAGRKVAVFILDEKRE